MDTWETLEKIKIIMDDISPIYNYYLLNNYNRFILLCLKILAITR